MLRWYEPVWLAFFAAAALKSTAVLALAWPIAKLLRGRSSAARHLVWTAAAAAVLALPLLSVSLPQLQLPVTLPSLTFQTTVTGQAAQPSLESASLSRAPIPQHANPRPWHIDWALCLMALWAAGTALALAQMIFAFIAMARVRAKARRYAFEDFSDLADEMEIARPVRVLETAPGSMPMTFGLWHPTIF